MGYYYTAKFDQRCDLVVEKVKDKLERRGIRVVPTFNLQVARESQVFCGCPHHGTSQCDCQYMVLLAYGPESGMGPSCLIAAHGHDDKTWLSLLREPDGQRKGHRGFETVLADALAEAALEARPMDGGALADDGDGASKKGKGVRGMAKDPVCGMEVEAKKAAAKSEHKGKTYYFCAPGCKAAFDKDPSRYVGKEERGRR